MRDDSEIDFSGFQIEDTPPLEVIPSGFLPEESPLADDESLDFSGFSETQDSPFGGSLVTPSLLEAGSTPSSLAAKAKALGLPASAAQTHPTEVADESRRVSEGWDFLGETHPALGKVAQDPETSYLVKDHISPLKSFLDAASRFWNGQRGEDKEVATALSAYTGSATNTVGSALKGSGEMYDSVLTVLDTNMRHSLGPKWDLVRANIESLTSGVDVSQIMKPGGVLRATLPHERAGGQAVFGSESLSYPTVDETLEALGSAVQEFSKETFYQADDKSPALYRLTSGLGSLSSQVLVSAVNPTAGALMLVALGADSQAQELESNTNISAHSRATAVIAGGAATMATTVPAIDRLLAKTKDLAKSAGASWTVDLIQAGLYNAVSEVADKGLQNKITGAATGEAPDLKIDDQFVVDTLVGMFTRGAVRSYEAVSSRKDQEESRGADAKALADALQQSGMAQESPEAFRSLVDDAFPHQQMYFSRESLQDVVDTMPSSRLSGVLQSAIDSSEPGEMVRLPPSAVLAADVPPEALGRLLQEARPSADADEVGTSAADMLRAAVSRASEVRDAEAIMQEVLPQLKGATRLNAREAKLLAQVIPQWAASKARREGKSPAQVMEESELVIGSDTKDPRSFSQETEVSPFESVSAEEFSAKIEEFRALGGRNRDVTAKTVEELQGAKMFLADEGRVGFAVMPDGEIASSFKFPGSSMKGALTEITRLAEKEGGTYRVVFDGPLIDIHRGNGWEVTERLEFDDQYAPEGWDFEERGRPDVLTLRRDGREKDGSLKGLPRTRGASAFPAAQQAAKAYMASRGLPYSPPSEYIKASPERGKLIAEEYEKAEHRPNDPEVIAAYNAMVEETAAQFRAILDTGLVVEFIEGPDPYAETPRMATEDVRNNNHLYVYSTREGFGSDTNFDPSESPLLRETEFTDVNGKPMLANDVFRVVHDYFGHVAEGVGFRADGEENAWRAHAAMYSPLARRAMTSETRGQNSWLNYGPYGEKNRTAKPNETHFADQKTTLLPEWVSEEGSGQKLNQGVSVTRGWYSPSRRLIALTSAESRTTFMHEMAHFMLDMEPPNSPLHKAVREWLSRKGLDDFLEEAVQYDRGLTESLNGEPNSRYSPEVVAMAKGGADFAGYVTFDRGGVPSREGLLELPPDTDLIDVTDLADKGLSDDAVAAYMEEGIPGAIVTIGGQKAYVVWDPRFVSQGDIARQRLLTGDAREYASNSVPGSTLTPLGARRYLLDGTSGDTGHDVAYLTAMHEKFARGFEEYLREGKSPSPEMDAAFLEASRWASDLYGDGESLTAGLDTQMRETLTALITVPEQVEARARFAGVEELFPSAKEADMSPSQFSQYQEERDQILAKAEKTVREKIESNIAATMKREYRRAVAEAEARIFEEIANDPVHVAVREIRENYPLDANAIKELVGEDYTTKDGDVVKAIPMKLLGLTRRGGIGHHPDVIAAAFGFESGQQMLRAIMDSKTQRQEARDRAEEEVKSSKGQLPTKDEVAQIVAETVDGSVSEELILLQLRAMNRSPAQKELAELRAKAKERIREIPLEEASAARYRASAAKEAKAAAREMRKGNRKAAEKHKRQQLVMSLMEKEAVRAHEKADKITARLSVYSKQKAATQLANRFPAGYWGVKGLLQQFNLGKVADIEGLPGTVVPLPLLENRLLREWGVAIDVPEAARTGEFPSPSQLTLNHLLSVEESVKSIEHVAKRLESYGKDASAKKVDEVVKALQDSQDGIRKAQSISDGPDSDLTTPSKWQKARKRLDDFISIQTKIPWMLRWMDGGGRAGLWYQTFAKPFVEAYRNADLLTRLVVTPMATALRERSSEDVKRHNTRHTFERPDGSSITLETHRILNLALHMGTLSGRRKVQEGHRLLSSGEDPESVGALTAQMLDVLTEKDWDLVKTYWQQLELLAKPLSEQHLRDTGREMTREEAAPFLTKFGEMPGGYAPLFKKRTLEDMVGSAEEDAGSMFEGSNFYNDIGVDTGARLDRTRAVYEVDLDLNRIAQHVRQVVHYVTHRDAVVDVNRLLRDSRVEKVVRERLGDSDWEQFRPWLIDIAKDGRASGADTAFDKTLSYLKNGTTIAVMGYRASTMAMQFLGLSNAAAEVGPLRLGKVVAKMSTSPSYLKEATAFAMENSRVLGARVMDYDRDVASALRNVDGSNAGALAAVRGGAFLPLAYVQLHAVDIPTWVAAYTKAVKAGDSQAVAVDYADFAVEQVQGSGKKMNSAALMRSGKATTQIFTMFMTFFSSLFNASRDLGVRFKDGNMSAFDVAGSALLMYAIPVALEMLIRGEVSEDDEDDMLEFGVNLLTYPLASVVGVRDLASAPHILGAITGDRVQFGQSISPVSQILGDTVAVAKVAGSLVSDNDVEPHEAKAAVRALGAWMQLPTGQLVSSTDYLLKRAQEGEDFSVRQFFIGADRQK